MKVAALYVDPRGPYPELVGAECCWDLNRDARTYSKPWPVVAHPPCRLWVNFAALNYKRWGGEHNRPGNDGGMFAHALGMVNRCGGVLEHPASSNAWKAYGLQTPELGRWSPSGVGWTCEVWQSAYGHRARKRTWLYYRGSARPFDFDWTRDPGTHQIGWFDRNKPTLGKRQANATPPAFARELIKLARFSREARRT